MVKKRASRARRYVSRAKNTYHKKAGIIGGLNLKGILMGAAMLSAGKIAVGMLAPGLPFQRQVGTMAGGVIAGATGLPGKALLGYGIMDVGSDILAGLVTGGGFGRTGGGYEF